MIYLVPNANCVCLNNNVNLLKGAKYALTDPSLSVFLANDCFPVTLNLYEICASLVNGGLLNDFCQMKNMPNFCGFNSADRVVNDKNIAENNKIFSAANGYNYNDDVNLLNHGLLNSAGTLEKGENISGNVCNKNAYNKSYNDRRLKMLDRCFGEPKLSGNACCCDGDLFVFLNFKPICNFAFHSFKFKNKEVQISLGERLVLSLAGEVVVDAPNRALNYSHFDTFGDFCFVYFEGARNFVVVLKNDRLFYADYYDLVECAQNEFYFLTRLKDSINHGRVCHINSGVGETYLVYLDEYELNLKSEFLPHVFLDCLLAGNYKYCNALLCDDLKQDTAADIANFFCPFERFYPLNKTKFAVIEKDAVVGIYKFEIENDRISNIAELTISAE